MSSSNPSPPSIDNARARVTRFHLPPGSDTGHHRHEFNYVIVPIVGGTLTIIDANGKTVESEISPGVPYYREAGVEHNVLNKTAHDIAFVEVELK